ncbi:acylphosphatase [Archaeoglobus neptunius]|uniref:acylphosphatase n=1 Tax=Archaeoglobus neptunius TaxID=2798580 RepID=UPI0019286931|nr:acylphosphatase [Archaeoglobus neptunius]
MMAVEVYVSGVVQGVGFRYFTRKVARELGIRGYVRNLSDGRVYIYAVGDELMIDKFLSAINRGPPMAIVRNVEVRKAGMERCDGFEVRY